MEDGFRDRADAGARLAERLMPLRDRNPIVVALPRGGVPVARPIATALGAPLEVIAVRKLGAPGNPELGMGAIAEDGTGVIDQATVRALGVSDEQLRFIIAASRPSSRGGWLCIGGSDPPSTLPAGP